jgi:hypothetical protein
VSLQPSPSSAPMLMYTAPPCAAWHCAQDTCVQGVGMQASGQRR